MARSSAMADQAKKRQARSERGNENKAEVKEIHRYKSSSQGESIEFSNHSFCFARKAGRTVESESTLQRIFSPFVLQLVLSHPKKVEQFGIIGRGKRSI